MRGLCVKERSSDHPILMSLGHNLKSMGLAETMRARLGLAEKMRASSPALSSCSLLPASPSNCEGFMYFSAIVLINQSALLDIVVIVRLAYSGRLKNA